MYNVMFITENEIIFLQLLITTWNKNRSVQSPSNEQKKFNYRKKKQTDANKKQTNKKTTTIWHSGNDLCLICHVICLVDSFLCCSFSPILQKQAK